MNRTPHWLIKKNQYGKAYLALKDLRETPLQAARKFEEEMAIIQTNNL